MTEPLDPASISERNNQASALMKQGIALLEQPGTEAAAGALDFFNQALSIRRALPYSDIPQLAFDLAACLVNKADALARLGPEQHDASLRAYDEAIAVLRRLPLQDDPRFPRRLAIACQNRGLALLSPGHADADRAAESFTEAVSVLDADYSRAIPDRPYLQAVVWLNLAGVRLADTADESRQGARDAALEAIALVAEAEAVDPAHAQVGLTARHVLCRTFVHRLSQHGDSEIFPDDVHAATDAADDGLALIRLWEQRGVGLFRNVALDLFRFGARVYAIYQPQFLAEFVEDNLDPAQSTDAYINSVEMQAAAEDARLLQNLPGR